ncbi:MAG: DUF3108 domain-containing protein [Acidobacteriota bacterium]
MIIGASHRPAPPAVRGAVPVTLVLAVAVFLPGGGPAEGQELAREAMPIDGPYAYQVEYLGLTCGHLTLESRLETVSDRPVYHLVATARNSRFFNKIYKVDARIDSWVDAQTLTTLAYESVIVEKGKRKLRRYDVDATQRIVRAVKNGKATTAPFDGRAGLDPLAFLFRARLLAQKPGSSFTLRMLTDQGPLETVSEVGGLERFKTFEGKRELLPVQPMPADQEMFSRKGEVVIWVDPGPERTLFRLVFHLPFGHLVAKLTGPAEE